MTEPRDAVPTLHNLWLAAKLDGGRLSGTCDPDHGARHRRPGRPDRNANLGDSLTCDPNGNQTEGLGRAITWTSYNKPSTITMGATTVGFLHDVDHERYKQVSPDGTTLYVRAFGVLAELAGPGTSTPRWTDYLAVGSVKVGQRVTDVFSRTVSMRFFHTDHLGSISVITDEAGVVVERLAYDAWGKRRHPNGADDPSGSIESQATRGFTGHEQLDAVALVHMNGRVYDPLVGRMISADPTVPDPMNAQAWNRYSYVGNDPLAFTDPSGYSWLSSFFRSVGNFFKSIFNAIPILRSIVQVVVAAALSWIPGVNVIVAAAASAAIVTGLSGGKLGDMLKNAAIAGGTAMAFWVVGGATNVAMGKEFAGEHFTPQFGQPEHLFNIAGHAGVGCLSSMASGGSCGSGAAAGAAGAAATPLIGEVFPNAKNDPGQFAGATAAHGLVGGLASVAGGGKFENGAVTGAFGYMFNQMAGRAGYDYENHCINDGNSCVHPILGLLGIPTGSVTAGLSAIFGRIFTTTLYRAVSQAEYDQLMSTGTFQAGPNSLGGKFFAETPGAAAQWGQELNGAGNFRLVEVKFPKATADSFMRLPKLDGIGPARYGELDVINSAKPLIRPLQ